MAVKKQSSTRYTRNLEALQDVSTAIHSQIVLSDVLNTTCQVIVELFGVDHSGFVLFDEKYHKGRVNAEYPPLGTLNTEILIDGVAAEEKLIALQEPLVASKVNGMRSLGPVRNILKKFGIQSILIVPIVYQEHVLGSFSLDAINRERIFTTEEVDLCRIFAALVAVSVKNAQLLAEAGRRTEQLETLRKTTLAITSSQEKHTLVQNILQQAINLLEAKSGAINQYHADRKYLEVIADQGRQRSTKGLQIRPGEGMAGYLLHSGAPYLIVPDYCHWPHRLESFAQDRQFRSVLAVSMTWNSELIGILYVDDLLGRVFTDQDANLLRLFADHAAITLVNSRLMEQEMRKLARLEQLSHTINRIMIDLGDVSLETRLNLIVHQAAEILEAEGCSISLVGRPGFLSFEASYGYKPGAIKKGDEFAIQSRERGGLSGHIAHSRKIFNAYGDSLTNHFAVKGEKQPPVSSGRCYSILAIPLIEKSSHQERLIGLLRVDNKLDENKEPGPEIHFSQEDEWILSLFADAAVVAIEGAGLVDELNRQREQFSRLVASSPNGVIANDQQGKVLVFNEKAEAILGYRRDEVIGQTVTKIYVNEQETSKIGQLIRDHGQIIDRETMLLGKSGEHIPVRLTATQLTNSQEQPIGYVGYFEDLRIIRGATARLELLLKASNMLAQASSLTDGLQNLAEMLVVFSGVSFCRIFLLDEQQTMLTTMAVFPLQGPTSDLNWQERIGQSTAVDMWPTLSDLLVKGEASVLRTSEQQGQILLKKWSEFLGLQHMVQSALVVPLQTRSRVVGLLALGEMRPPARASISEDTYKLVVTIAEQTAVLIERFHLYERTKETKSRLRSSFVASNALVTSQNPEQVWKDIVYNMRDVAEATGVRMFLIAAEVGQVTELIATGTETLNIHSAIRPNGLSMKVMDTGMHQIVEDANKEADRVNPSFFSRGIMAAIGFPVSVEGKRIGVLWAYYDRPRRFAKADIEALQLYVNQAAIAYENARQIKKLHYMYQAAETLASAHQLPSVLKRIVESACQVLSANSAFVWSYDNVRRQFNPHDSVAVGIPELLWHKFRKHGPRPGGTADTVLSSGWIGVRDVTDYEAYPFLGQTTLELLREVGAHSFQGIALAVNDENLGVLYVNYNKPHHFSQEERESARIFANYAALALKNAQLLAQVRNARDTAGIVARVITLADIRETLQAVAEGMYDVLHCDVITLYDFDQDKEKFVHGPEIIGAYWPDRVRSPATFRQHGLVYQVLQYEGKLLIEPDVSSNPLFAESRFTHEEKIASCVAFPLRVGQQTVGVMFINFRTPHHFSEDEQISIDLFANQAAIAIHNAQLFERERRQTIALQALDKAAHAITGSLNLEETFFAIAEQAAALTAADGTGARFSHLGLVENGGTQLCFKATWPREHLPDLQQTVGCIDLQAGERIGVTGQAVATGKPILVRDVKNNNDYYIEYNPKTRSEIAVPIKMGEEVIGVINLEHFEPNAFDLQDQQTLATLAEYASIAIKNAELYERKRKHTAVLEVLQEATRAVTSTLNLDEILNYIAERATCVVRYQEQQTSYSSIWLLIDESKVEPVAAFPPEDLSKARAVAKDGINLQTGIEGRIGITGRALLEGRNILVSNVKENIDYLTSHEETLSELVVVMKLGEQVIGAINVEHSEFNAFDEEDVRALDSLAAQAAIAIRNAQEYQEVTILQKAAAALAGPHTLLEVLDHVMRAAMHLTKTTSGSVLFWNEKTKTIAPAFTTTSANSDLVAYTTAARQQGGFTRQIIRSKKSVIFPDTRQEPNINPVTLQKGRLSVVGVPIIREDAVIAVLYVHSPKPSHFREHQVTVLETLANQAAVAIDKAQQYEELVKTKGRVGSRTALAWMGMLSSFWRHDIEQDAVVIRDAAKMLLSKDTQEQLDPKTRDAINLKLDMIHRKAKHIMDSPTTPPLSAEDVGPVTINNLLRERLQQLWKAEPYKHIDTPYQSLDETDDMQVVANYEWLRVVLDELVKNAVDAMAKNTKGAKHLEIKTSVDSHYISVAISDTGRGIAPKTLETLFSAAEEKPKRDGHLGRGLLMVQAIVETYDGDLSIPKTSSHGTTVCFRLPRYQNE